MTVEDVTEKFIDAESRLNTKKQIENRYLELLKEAKNVQDMLAVEKELRVILEEIDATEGKLRYLNDKILYSTITLSYYQPVEGGKEPGPGFIKKTGKALHGGWELFAAIGYRLLYIWPIILIVPLLYIFIRRHGRKKREMRERN